MQRLPYRVEPPVEEPLDVPVLPDVLPDEPPVLPEAAGALPVVVVDDGELVVVVVLVPVAGADVPERMVVEVLGAPERITVLRPSSTTTPGRRRITVVRVDGETA